MAKLQKLATEDQQEWMVYKERFKETLWKDVACGWAWTLLVSHEGKVYGVGSSQWNEIDGKKSGEEQELTEIRIPEKIMTVACGWRHAVALSHIGNVYGWGWGRHGQLGPSKVKIEKKDVRSVQKIELDQKIVQVSCGHLYTLFRAQDSTVYCVGSNKYKQIANEDQKMHILDPQIAFRGSDYIDSGWNHTLSLGNTSELLGYGRNDHGQISKGLCNIKAFCCGSEHNLAIQGDRLIGWGWNEHGNCTSNVESTNVPVFIDSNIAIFGAGCATSWYTK